MISGLASTVVPVYISEAAPVSPIPASDELF